MRCGRITTVPLPASVLGPASKAARLFSRAQRQSRVRRRRAGRRARRRGPAGRPGRRAGRRARPPGGPGPDRAAPGAGTRTGSSPAPAPAPAPASPRKTTCTRSRNGRRRSPRLVYADRDPIVLPHANRLRGAPPGTTAYIYGELSSASIYGELSSARFSRVPAGRGQGRLFAGRVRRPCRCGAWRGCRRPALHLSKRVSALSSSLRNSGREVERQAAHTEAQARAWCARCRGCSRGRCGRRRSNLSGPCSGLTSGSTGPGRPRRARRPGRGSRCRTGSRPGPGTRPSQGSRR